MTTRRFSLPERDSLPADSMTTTMNDGFMLCHFETSPPLAFAVVSAPSGCAEMYQAAYEKAVASVRSIRFERMRRFSAN